ncbi:minor tail protein [Mycobacterium phage LeMond]|uniref:Minor tail protein n=1 Tax=Mycobacterium phage KiSi TaxID=2507856 RepID=A0A410TBN2_9CAUD|nr:minor tail protein [Mycobacterium phage KiSi]AYR01088.1 minor tail protein [Mycobacterium phage LeMond]AYR01190.1 minor tail protein [Mycobacterium phage Oscar]AYR01623.1 minor tail protein [Mycobacterium phage Scarlett]QAU06441.1 minor tail protein [Mycobacterium phage KiSi]
MLPPLPPLPDVPEHVPGLNSIADAMHDIAELLQYPADSRGRRYDVRYLVPVLAFHLAQAGCVVVPDRAVIKKRRLPLTAGVVEDAVEWVAVDAPDSIEDELHGATLDDLPLLSAAARAEFIRRATGKPLDQEPADVDLDARTAWHTQTSIVFDDDDTP